jgi:hypothetical protein
MRFPRPRGTLPPRPVPPAPTAGQRPTRRARSARRGRGGRWPGAFGPRLAWDQRGAVAGAVAPAMATALAVRIQIVRALFGRERETHCVSPPVRDGAPQIGRSGNSRRPAPDPAGEKRPPGRGGRWPGALGPRRAKAQRGAVAGAMAPAIAAVKGRSSVRAGTGNALRFPARAGRFPVDRQVQAHGRPAPDPAGGKRPPGAGRALAGGFGPPAGLGSAWRCGRGDGRCQSDRASRHGQGHRLSGRDQGTHRVSPPVRDGSPQTGRAGKSRRPAPAVGGAGAGRGLWAPGWPRGSVALWQG